MYELLGISLVGATLLIVNAAASVLATGCWRLFEKPASHWSPRSRAGVLFAMRVSPPALAFISVTLFLIPSYLGYEPYSTSEVVSKKLAALAIVAVTGVAFAVWRGFRSWFATRALKRSWLAIAAPTTVNGIEIPTFRIPHSFPIIAIVGTFKPRLFIADRVLQTLSQAELAAAIAHERGHLAAHDNLKRVILRACRDVLMIVPCGRALDRAWAETAECAADEHAAQQSPVTALNLASALVRIAKMIPPGMRAKMPLAAFLVGAEETRGVKARVRRLLEIASSDYRRRVANRTSAKMLSGLALSFFAVVAVMVANSAHVLMTVHSLIERVVFLLS